MWRLHSILVVTAFFVARSAEAQSIDFNHDVLPILAANCFECHGPDASTRKAKLRLDLREEAMAARKAGAAVVPGNPEKSLLVQRITAADQEDVMPPAKKGPRLSAEQIGALREWIAQGATYAEHWAFVPPARPAIPEVKDAGWARGEIDRFVLARLERETLAPAKPASRETLIRRATLDLIGLPPSPEEVAEFVADDSPDAYERLIDRLLASPHYGERWGRHWLDVARYADSGGFETDIFFGHAWRYRDYVTRSLNADKPYSRFVREQIAGDELYPGNREALLATGLYTTGPVLQEAGMVEGKLEYDQLTDAADTTGSAFLGLTLGCARCHDHKYDPISQREYFGIQALFAASDQFDLKADGTKLRGRAALKNTQKEFELEQAKARARREEKPAVREEYVRRVGDYFVAADSQLNARVELTRAHQALERAAQRYKTAQAKGGVIDPVGDAGEPKRIVGDDDDAANNNDDDVVVAPTAVAATVEDLLVEVGRRAMEIGGRSNPSRRAFRQLQSEPERRAFLIDLGKKNLEPKRPENLVADIDRLRYEVGANHLSEESAIPVRVLAHRETPLETRVLVRGELEQPGEAVSPGFPAKLAADVKLANVPQERRRAALADWIASDRNPLTARVIVNRAWQWHFGLGIVRTPGDFGIRGERPTHPELLDWLAVQFIEDSWSLKRLHRRIMLSSTYRMSAEAEAATVARDPENRLLTRYQPRRLEAEAIWDSIRAVAGTLNREMYGLPVAPPLDEQEQIGNFRKWPVSTPQEANRRAVYILVKRSFRFPMLSAFDLPDNISTCSRRDITTVPNQALTLLNNRTMREQAEAFAGRLIREAGERPEDVAAKAWLHAYGRAITDEERHQAIEFLGSRTRETESMKSAVTELCLALFNTNEFIYLQ
jgi:hypothetical protein